MVDLPESHKIANEQLEGEAYYDLFEIRTRDNSLIYLHKNSDVTWRGNLYKGWALTFSGAQEYSSEERSRPTLALMNIDGIFNPFIRDGVLNRAVVTRKRVLKQHILSNADVAQERKWLTWNPREVNRNVINLMLRTFSDGQGFTVPARRYMPPEFPYVSLG